MNKLTNSYSAFGARPFNPVREVVVENACRSIRETARDYRTDAVMKGRTDADEAEQSRWKADILDMALSIMEGNAAPAVAPEAPTRRGPVDHSCSFPGCGEPAPFGFGPIEFGRWACSGHRAEVEQIAIDDQADRDRKTAAATVQRIREADRDAGKLI